MNNGRARLEAIEKKVGGQLRTSRNGQPYLVIQLIEGDRLRVMYFDRTRQFKIYRDSRRSKSQPIAKCTTTSEAAHVIETTKAHRSPVAPHGLVCLSTSYGISP